MSKVEPIYEMHTVQSYIEKEQARMEVDDTYKDFNLRTVTSAALKNLEIVLKTKGVKALPILLIIGDTGDTIQGEIATRFPKQMAEDIVITVGDAFRNKNENNS